MQATQIYIKTHEAGIHPPLVDDKEEAEKVLYSFVQTIVQKTQQHMFNQLEQCMQQTYSGLTLGTLVHSQEYAEQFTKSNNSVLLTTTKCTEVDPYFGTDNWDDDIQLTQDQTVTHVQDNTVVTDADSTSLKTTNQPDSGYGGARQKTG